MKDIRLHVTVLVLCVISELIGSKSFAIGVGKIVLLPMFYALIMGVLTAPPVRMKSRRKIRRS